jgi:hypothetical protein
MLHRNNADRELGCPPIVRAVDSDGSYGVAAEGISVDTATHIRSSNARCNLI